MATFSSSKKALYDSVVLATNEANLNKLASDAGMSLEEYKEKQARDIEFRRAMHQVEKEKRDKELAEVSARDKRNILRSLTGKELVEQLINKLPAHHKVIFNLPKATEQAKQEANAALITYIIEVLNEHQ